MKHFGVLAAFIVFVSSLHAMEDGRHPFLRDRRYSIVFTSGKNCLRICGEFTDEKQVQEVVEQCRRQMPDRALVLYVHNKGRTIMHRIPEKSDIYQE